MQTQKEIVLLGSGLSQHESIPTAKPAEVLILVLNCFAMIVIRVGLGWAGGSQLEFGMSFSFAVGA
jgi:hypothetical protein